VKNKNGTFAPALQGQKGACPFLLFDPLSCPTTK